MNKPRTPINCNKKVPKRAYFDIFLEIPCDTEKIQLSGIYHKMKVAELKNIIEQEVGLLPEMYYLTYLDDAALTDTSTMADNDIVINATLTVKPWRMWIALLTQAYKGNILKSIHIAHSMEGSVADKKHFAWVALYIAAHRGHFRLVAELLKECLIGINASSPTGWTALHAAARKGHWGVLCVLLDKGGNIQIKDKDGRTPFDIARQYNKKKCEQSLNFCDWNYQKYKVDVERKFEYDARKARDVACRRTHMAFDSSLKTWLNGAYCQRYMVHLPNAVKVSEVKRFDESKQKKKIEDFAIKTHPGRPSSSPAPPEVPKKVKNLPKFPKERRGGLGTLSSDSDSDDGSDRIYFDYGWFDPIRAQEFIPPTHDILRYSNPSSSHLRPRSVANPFGYVEKLNIPSPPITAVKSLES